MMFCFSTSSSQLAAYSLATIVTATTISSGIFIVGISASSYFSFGFDMQDVEPQTAVHPEKM